MRSQAVVVFPPAGYDTMGEGQGSVQAFDLAMHKPQVRYRGFPSGR